jgi:cytochrome c553
VSVKYQITLPEQLAEEMRATAARLKVPMAQFIRETMEDKLRDLKSRKRKERPLEWMRGMAKGIKDTDLASRIDEILYK